MGCLLSLLWKIQSEDTFHTWSLMGTQVPTGFQAGEGAAGTSGWLLPGRLAPWGHVPRTHVHNTGKQAPDCRLPQAQFCVGLIGQDYQNSSRKGQPSLGEHLTPEATVTLSIRVIYPILTTSQEQA